MQLADCEAHRPCGKPIDLGDPEHHAQERAALPTQRHAASCSSHLKLIDLSDHYSRIVIWQGEQSRCREARVIDWCKRVQARYRPRGHVVNGEVPTAT